MGYRVAVSLALTVVTLAAAAAASQSTASGSPANGRSLVEQEANIAVHQPGPHDGGGVTTAFPFFEKVSDFKMAFRKRILHQGSAIGYHRQDFDEVYYIISGTGEYTLNGVPRAIGPGTAMLTRPGDSHGLRPTGTGDLVMIIAYQLPGR